MKSLKLYLIVGGVILLIYILAQLNRPKKIDWSNTLSSKDKIPFGTYILNNRLNDIFHGSQIITYRQPVYNVIAEDSISKSSYLIICPEIELSTADYTQLIKYIKAGNDVFIAAQYFGTLLNKNLDISTEYKYTIKQENMPVRFLNPNLDTKKLYTLDKGVGNIYFSKFDTLHTVVIGENADHQANFIKYSFGKGSLYLMSNPKFFSNYSLLNSQGAVYAATALSFIKSANRLVVDEYYSQGNGGNASPMRVFLSNPALQWAYYIAIFSLLIFVLFEMKRRQRIIPVIEPLSNSTLEFVNVVGQVYYEKRNNVNIAQKKILYFLEHLRDEHQLKTNKLDDEFVEKLTAKLDINRSLANELVNYIKYITVQDRITDHELIELNKLIEQFYIKSR
ncbi:MAG: hypothetical protein JWP45_1929 [Mucilaginibacter sp.]|nr:hypothetical protein [Mucilaginibacter sp.]